MTTGDKLTDRQINVIRSLKTIRILVEEYYFYRGGNSRFYRGGNSRFYREQNGRFYRAGNDRQVKIAEMTFPYEETTRKKFGYYGIKVVPASTREYDATLTIVASAEALCG